MFKEWINKGFFMNIFSYYSTDSDTEMHNIVGIDFCFHFPALPSSQGRGRFATRLILYNGSCLFLKMH